jgi:hypothetical protein
MLEPGKPIIIGPDPSRQRLIRTGFLLGGLIAGGGVSLVFIRRRKPGAAVTASLCVLILTLAAGAAVAGPVLVVDDPPAKDVQAAVSLVNVVCIDQGNEIVLILGKEAPKLERSAAAAGVLVGPGAVGLAAGMWYARTADFNQWIFLVPLGVSIAVVLPMKNVSTRMSHQAGRNGDSPSSVGRSPTPSLLGRSETPSYVDEKSVSTRMFCAGAMLLAIAVRAATGHSVGLVHQGETTVLWGLAIAACAGAILGGFVADRLGWMATCACTLLFSAPLLGPFVDNDGAAIVGVVLVQMTMPVTLQAASRAFPGEPGLAFGLAAFAVLLGAVPAYVCPIKWTTSPGVLLGAALTALVAVLLGLPPLLRGGRQADRVSP